MPSLLAQPTPSRLPAALSTGLASTRLPGLDGLRMVAVFLVVLYHFGLEVIPGDQGVMMFFVLSGFLITWLLLAEQESAGSISLRQFYLRRVLRIFPAFYCYWLLVTGVLLLIKAPVPWGQALSALGYVSNYYQGFRGDPVSPYSHTWSLAVEEQFYLLWPLALRALVPNPRRLGTALVVVIAAISVHRLILHVAFHVGYPYLYEAFDARADALAVGCLLAVVLRRGYLPRLWSALCTARMSILTVALLAAATLLRPGYRLIGGYAVQPLLVAVLIAQVIALRGSPLWRWLNWPPVRYLGVLSYSIYLYQEAVIPIVRGAFASSPLMVSLGASVTAVLLMAAASYHLIERPFLRLKETIATSSPTARPKTRPVLNLLPVQDE